MGFGTVYAQSFFSMITMFIWIACERIFQLVFKIRNIHREDTIHT